MGRANRRLTDLSHGERARLERVVRAGDVTFREIAELYGLNRNTVADLATDLGAPSQHGERHWREYPIRTAESTRLTCELCHCAIERGARIRRSGTIAAHAACVDGKAA